MDADDDIDVPRRKRPRAAAPLYYSETTDAFRHADAHAVDAALASLRTAATTVEDGPMRSVAIAPLAAGTPGAGAIYGALADAIEASGAPRPRRLATAQLAVYETGDHFSTWHVDETDDDGRLAIVVFLSEPSDFEGGEFDAEEAILPARPPARSFVVFDASRLRHRVRAVRRGRREALLCWTASPSDPATPVTVPPATRAAPPTTVKIVVWDLDGTLWRGTLDDDGAGGRVEPRRALVDAIGALTDRGVVSTVCSRAPQAAAETMLDALGVRGLLVFNAYDVAGSKGARVLQTLDAMHLSPCHALFVDDEAGNRADVLHRCDGIGALAPEDVEALLPLEWGAPDPSRERLVRYKVLERKHETRASVDDDDDDDDAFLRRCSIKATVSRVSALDPDADRLVELLQRSNRLNYTKDRPDATWDVLDEAAGAYDRYKDEPGERRCWKVVVRDAFGEYGVVGVVAASRFGDDWQPRHFTFSCRCAGMRVDAALAAWLVERLGASALPVAASGLFAVDASAVAIELDDAAPAVAIVVDDAAQPAVPPVHAKRALLRGWCATLQLAPLLNATPTCVPARYAATRFSSVHFLRAASRVPTLFPAALRALATVDTAATVPVNHLWSYDVVVQDCEVDALWPAVRGFPVDLAHNDCDCAPGLADAWAALWRRAVAAPRDAVAADFGIADLLTPAAIAEDVRWLRDQVAPGTFLILLLTPDLWDLELAAPGWRDRLSQIPATLRERLSARLAEINAAISRVAADLPNTVTVDRTALLRPGEVQEHTHVCRRAQVAVADCINLALTL